MKKFFCFIFSLLLFVSVFGYANAQDDMGDFSELENEIAAAFEGMKDLYKDLTPEEKAICKKMMEDQMNSTLALMEISYKRYMKEITDSEEKKEYENEYKKQLSNMEQIYNKSIKEMGL